MRAQCGLLPAGLALLLWAGGAHADDVAFTPITQGDYSGVTERRFVVIDGEQQWRQLWHTHRNTRELAVPPVDFGRSMVLAIFMGQQRSGGYGIRINNIESVDGRIDVELVESRPSPEQDVSMALTQPHVIVRLPRMRADFDFSVTSAQP